MRWGRADAPYPIAYTQLGGRVPLSERDASDGWAREALARLTDLAWARHLDEEAAFAAAGRELGDERVARLGREYTVSLHRAPSGRTAAVALPRDVAPVRARVGLLAGPWGVQSLLPGTRQVVVDGVTLAWRTVSRNGEPGVRWDLGEWAR